MRIPIGRGWFHPFVLLQSWYFLERGECAGFQDCKSTTSAFRLRRAQLGLNGDIITDVISFRVDVDASRLLEFRESTVAVASPGTGSVRVLQPSISPSILTDAWLTFRSKYGDFTAGQFRIPVSYEGFNGSTRMLLPERSIVSRRYGDRRDLGLELMKTFPRLRYAATLVNGSGSNRLETNESKDAGLRLEVFPLKPLMIGGLVYSSIGERASVGTKDRWELDLRYELKPFLFQSEFIRARDRTRTGIVHSSGSYVAAAFSPLEKLQLVARFSWLDPALGGNLTPSAANDRDDEVVAYEAGINYFVLQHEAKLQLLLSHFDFQDRRAATQAIFALQLAM